jgi:hypothetical protein
VSPPRTSFSTVTVTVVSIEAASKERLALTPFEPRLVDCSGGQVPICCFVSLPPLSCPVLPCPARARPAKPSQSRAEPIRMSLSTQASNKAAALCLLSRGLTLSYTDWKGESLFGDEGIEEESESDDEDEGEGEKKMSPGESSLSVAERREDGGLIGDEKEREPPASEGGAVAERFLSELGCSDCATLADGLAKAFATAYQNEEGFNTKLFGALFTCFASSHLYEAVNPGNSTSMIVLIPNDASMRCLANVGGTYYEFAMGLVRKPKLLEREASVIKGQPEPDHAWALCRRKPPPAPRRSRRRTPAADAGRSERGGPSDCGGVPSARPDTDDGTAKDPVVADTVATAAAAGGGGGLVVDRETGSEDSDTHDTDRPDEAYKSRSGEGEWEIFRVLATVELKLHSATSVPFVRIGDEAPMGVNQREIDMVSDHFPLAQALMYAFGAVLWDRAALGLKLPKSLPVAVVAVRRVSDPNVLEVQAEGELGTLPQNATRWLHGNLLIPEKCGGRFYCNVDAFGMFHNSAGASALAAYLVVMSRGLKAASKWLKLVRESGRVLPPRSMTGRTLFFPGCEDILTKLSILSWPVTPSSDDHFQISQGELWKGKLDLKSLYGETMTKPSDPVYWCCDDAHDLPPEEAGTVLVKVTSESCYGLVTGGQGFLYQINNYKKDRAPEVVRRVFRLLKDSLYAVYVPATGSGVVQIMPDLRQAEYQQLRPSAQLLSAEAWIAAWDAFRALVVDVLIPLAEYDIIHVDIRPGFEWTANLLYRPTDSKMRLIDADSLARFDDWLKLSQNVKGSKLITARPGPDDPQSSLEFVLWQVIYVAETWISRTSSHAASILPIFVSHKTDRVNSLLAGRSSYDRASIVAGLDRYGQEIAGVAADLAQAARSAAEASAAASSVLPGAAGAAAPVPAVTADTTQQAGMTMRSKRSRPKP